MNLVVLNAAPDRQTAEEFMTVLAHDLCNLLTPLALRLDMIHLEIASGQQPQEREVVAAQEAVRRLARMVGNMLSVTRLERGLFALHRQPTDLAPLVRETCTILATPAHPVRIRTPDRLPVSADPHAIRQALENLIANAIRYSPSGTPVEVTVTRDRRGGATWAVVTVRDGGPGIPAELRARLGERYVRGGGSPGLGLGLYLVRQIAEAHGGSLEIGPLGDAGTTISLAWPVSDPQSGRTAGGSVE